MAWRTFAKRIFCIFSLVLSLLVVNSQADHTIQILHGGDFEGIWGNYEDVVGFSAIVEYLKSLYPSDTIVLSTGDNYISGPTFRASADPRCNFNGVCGRGDINILNNLGVQASTVGNHEFDAGILQIKLLLEQDAAIGYPGTKFPFLCANLDFSRDKFLAEFVAPPALPWQQVRNRIAPSTRIKVGDYEIGVVGVTIMDKLSKIKSLGFSTNVAEDVQSAVDELVATGARPIILLAHAKNNHQILELSQRLHDVDVIVVGGLHTITQRPGGRIRFDDRLEGDYLTCLLSISNRPTYMVHSAPLFRYVGRLLLSLDERGKITKVYDASGLYPTDKQGAAEAAPFKPTPAILSQIASLNAVLYEKDRHILGITTVYLEGRRPDVRERETNLGDLLADACLARAKQTDSNTCIAIINSGSIRTSIGTAVSGSNGVLQLLPPQGDPSSGKRPGQISQVDIEMSVPYNNALCLLDITAAQLLETLENGVSSAEPSGTFPQISGLSFSYDLTRPKIKYEHDEDGDIIGIASRGKRVRSVIVNKGETPEIVAADGNIVGDPNRIFRIVVTDFMAGGGNQYYLLTLCSNKVSLATNAASYRTFDIEGTEQSALGRYLADIRTYSEPDPSRENAKRIRNVTGSSNK